MADEDKGTGPAHQSGARKGEEVGGSDEESGREEGGTSGADRPTGTATPRMSTGINPDDMEPIDPESPYMPAP